ncbi:hypothetical protein BDZ89DRAFT_1152406 [Hymenopellis radicata]|nr:hypothetical protein BDZ89DRAFT_1152406 [Hymenopellis radicata]
MSDSDDENAYAPGHNRHWGQDEEEEGSEEESYQEHDVSGQQDEQDANDDELGLGPSMCNSGKGILYNVSLVPLLPLLKPGEKRRANAKPKAITGQFFAHEDLDLGTIIEYCINAVGRDSASLNFKIVGTALRSQDFTITYTLPRSAFKGVPLKGPADLSLAVDTAKDKATPTIQFSMTEIESARTTKWREEELARSMNANKEGSGGDSEGKESENGTNNPLEDKQTAVIADLKIQTICNDNECSNKGQNCYLDAVTGAHVFLSHTHFEFWSAGIVSGTPGVTMKCAPNTVFFQMGRTNEDVITLNLARINLSPLFFKIAVVHHALVQTLVLVIALVLQLDAPILALVHELSALIATLAPHLRVHLLVPLESLLFHRK